MNIQTLLARNNEHLTPSEKLLVRVLLDKPTKAAFLSITKLSTQAGVHPSTAVRLAKKLGFNGYPGMRDALQDEIVHLSEPAERIIKRLARTESQQILPNLVESESASLRELCEHVTQDQINTAANFILKANRIYIFAQGHANALADLMDRRLRRFGMNTVILTSLGRDLAERLVNLNKNDLLLAFAFHTRPPGLVMACRRALTKQANIILVSDSPSMLTALTPTVLLAAPRGEESEYQTLSVPMAICNALVLTIAHQDKGRSLQVLEDLSHLMEDIECEDEVLTFDNSHQ